MSVTDRVVPALLGTYKAIFSPLFASLGARCQHTPSCSEYAAEAVLRHGWLRGMRLGAWRVLRCHPLGTHGYDPVPPARGARGVAGCQDACEGDCSHA